LLALSACATGAQQIVETRDLSEAGGPPSISEVVDLGGADIPLNGELRLRGRNDGVAVIGETLWIRGKSFGRQPTVTIGGRPATVWSRTGDGGLLVRVPVGATAGATTAVVKQERGQAQAPLDVRRYAAVLAGGRLTWLDVSGETPEVAGETEVPGARFVRLSPDGRAAYVAGSNGLDVFETTAPVRPEGRHLPSIGAEPVIALAGATAANLLAVVRAADVVLFELGAPLRPRQTETLPLPPLVRAGRVTRAELSPDGRLLAFALAEGNRMVLAQTSRLAAGDGAIVADLSLAADTRAPVLLDLAFAHDGRTLWVVAGDSAESKPLGPQPTQVFALRVRDGASGRLELARTVAVQPAGEPARLSTGRSLPLSSGAAVRLPPEKATVFLTAGVRGAARSAVFSIGAADTATEILAAPGGAQMGGLDITPEGRWLLAAAVEGGRVSVLAAPADGRPGQVRTLTVAAGTSDAPAEVRIQP
jgi:hypothetical protein